ncbi:MAG: hypothetical protein L0Y60_04400, partial [Beijerinckiaceae bacterium]|nr:hypothetical protein [Beijerinckiaceae bacterium]
MTVARSMFGHVRQFHATASILALLNDGLSTPLAAGEATSDHLGMAGDDKEDFRVRPGRSHSRGPRADARSQPFLKQVQAAIRDEGGNPNRIGGSAGKGSGRFNARGRGGQVVASLPRDGAGWRRDSGGRFRSRRVVV